LNFFQISRTGGYFIQIFENFFLKNPEARGSAILEILKTPEPEVIIKSKNRPKTVKLTIGKYVGN